MTKSRNILKPRAVWTPEQIAVLREMYPHHKTSKVAPLVDKTPAQVFSKGDSLGLKKTKEYLASPDAGRLQRGENIGKSHRFLKGHVPANKGKKGVSYPGTEATQFKKGNKPHTWQPIGTERYSKEGYLQVKISDTGMSRHDFVPVHQLVWQLHHGDIPEKHHVAFKDRSEGSKERVAIENLELLSYAEMMRRNSYHTNLPKEFAVLVQLRGVIQRKINRRIKDGQSDSTTSADQ